MTATTIYWRQSLVEDKLRLNCVTLRKVGLSRTTAGFVIVGNTVCPW
jgi:hypothetical protein